MSYIDIERSEQNAQPVELYKIKLGQRMFYLTSHTEDYYFQYNVYKPIQLKRDEITHDLKLFDEKLKISIPSRSDIAKEMQNYSAEEESEITVFRTFVGITDYYVLWTGLILQKSLEKEYFSLISMPVNYALEKIGNRGRYSRSCRHVLYSHPCGLIKNNFATAGTITGKTNLRIALSVPVDNTYLGGIIEFSSKNVQRMIVEAEGNVVTIITPVFGVNVGDNIRIFKGCDKSMESCKRFNNIENYGGFPFIPVRNIFTDGAK